MTYLQIVSIGEVSPLRCNYTSTFSPPHNADREYRVPPDRENLRRFTASGYHYLSMVAVRLSIELQRRLNWSVRNPATRYDNVSLNRLRMHRRNVGNANVAWQDYTACFLFLGPRSLPHGVPLRVLGATESIIEAPLTIIHRYPAPNGRE